MCLPACLSALTTVPVALPALWSPAVTLVSAPLTSVTLTTASAVPQLAASCVTRISQDFRLRRQMRAECGNRVISASAPLLPVMKSYIHVSTQLYRTTRWGGGGRVCFFQWLVFAELCGAVSRREGNRGCRRPLSFGPISCASVMGQEISPEAAAGAGGSCLELHPQPEGFREARRLGRASHPGLAQQQQLAAGCSDSRQNLIVPRN